MLGARAPDPRGPLRETPRGPQWLAVRVDSAGPLSRLRCRRVRRSPRGERPPRDRTPLAPRPWRGVAPPVGHANVYAPTSAAPSLHDVVRALTQAQGESPQPDRSSAAPEESGLTQSEFGWSSGRFKRDGLPLRADQRLVPDRLAQRLVNVLSLLPGRRLLSSSTAPPEADAATHAVGHVGISGLCPLSEASHPQPCRVAG